MSDVPLASTRKWSGSYFSMSFNSTSIISSSYCHPYLKDIAFSPTTGLHKYCFTSRAWTTMWILHTAVKAQYINKRLPWHEWSTFFLIVYGGLIITPRKVSIWVKNILQESNLFDNLCLAALVSKPLATWTSKFYLIMSLRSCYKTSCSFAI